MKTAVITGASSGIGRAFAKKIALSGEAEELWVIARRADRLSALADKLNIPVRRFMLDLGQPSSIEELKRLLREHKPDVRYLVNAAGFGKIGNYNDLTREEIHG
ncbi:MAG: SDR family NAD(P)-dependent oxidoreductase, partial [Eubacteriales bacterium]|nr:SDR family NAD(P)-dependent oxidoreductase [Eubacteriales bacterium]